MQTAILLWVTLRTDWNKEVGIPKTCRIKDTVSFLLLYLGSIMNAKLCRTAS